MARGRRKQIPPQKAKAKKKVQIAQSSDGERYKDRRILWSFAEHDRGGEFSLRDATSEDVREILMKLEDFSSMTLGEFVRHGSEHCKRYDVAAIEKFARDRLVALKKDDETHICRLRFSGEKRLYGFLRKEVFNIVWWDPDHRIYPSKKRNT